MHEPGAHAFAMLYAAHSSFRDSQCAPQHGVVRVGGRMLRFCATSLTALVMAVVGVTTAAASPLLDPIVRTRGGGTGSYQIFSLPYFFDFGSFPTDPDTLPANTGLGDNCSVGTDIPSGLPMVSCDFQNLTGQFISQLTFQGSIPGGQGSQLMEFQDPDGLFTTDPAPFTLTPPASFTALFAGGGVAPGVCTGDLEIICFGGDFSIDLIGFPVGSNITMVASTEVPEPASLMLLGTGLGLGAAYISKRRHTSTRRGR